MRGHNICFHCEIRKTIFELSSITSLIGSSAEFEKVLFLKRSTIKILSSGIDKSQHADSDRGLHCLPFHLHFLDAFLLG